MADEGSGGYMNYGDDGESDFKRKADQKKEQPDTDDDEQPINDYYIKELLSERVHIDGKYPHADRLLENEIQNAKKNGRLPAKDTKYVDIYLEKPIKVVVKVIVPVKEHPKFNFVGKLLGPKGNSLRRLQDETMCKMAVMGRGSMKDRTKEETLRQGLDPKYAHLNDQLHVEISTLAPPAEAHARIAFALAEVRKYLIPDSNDNIRQEQFRELVADGSLSVDYAKEEYYSHLPPPPGYPSKRPPPPPVHHRSRSPSRVAMPPKQKVMSILDRARSAMDDRYPSRSVAYSDPEADYDYDRRTYHSEMEYPPPRARPSERPEPLDYPRDYREAVPYVKQSAHHSRSSGSSGWRSAYPDPAADAHFGTSHRIRTHHSHPDRSYRDSPYMRPK